ncbi:MAG TPA: DUF4270 domain-containing protein, partial [Daejeonella sp.]|nr:DUF4270 domain-containing protein [Daejeonella sp.]
MKLYKQDLLTLLISLFIFTGCENPDSIGLDVDPENAIEGKLIDSVTVRSATVKEDSVTTNGLSKYPMGYLNDPSFGPTDAKLAVSLNLPSESVSFGKSPILDSAVLVLRYSDEYTGDVNSQLMVEVGQLAERLTINSNYFSNAEHPAKPGTVGSKLAKVNLKDSVSIIQIVKGQPDITVKRGPQLRIPLSAAFIQTNFLNADSTHFKNTSAFNDFIKGLQIRVNKDLTTGAGGLATFNLADSTSRVEVYYRNQSGTTIDTTVRVFPVNTSASAATVTHSYAGTPVETQLKAPATTYEVNYIQPLGGVKTHLTFPYIENLKALGNITINKAELVVQVQTGTDIFSPSPRLFLYRTDIAGQRQLIPDVLLGISDASLGGIYIAASKQYKFTLTAYVQDLLNGKLNQYNTYITAIDSKASNDQALFPSPSTVSRVAIGSGSGTG